MQYSAPVSSFAGSSTDSPPLASDWQVKAVLGTCVTNEWCRIRARRASSPARNDGKRSSRSTVNHERSRDARGPCGEKISSGSELATINRSPSTATHWPAYADRFALGHVILFWIDHGWD